MGVKDLQKLIKKYGEPERPDTFQYAILDGSNLLCATVSTVLKNMYNDYPYTQFQGFSLNINNQISIFRERLREALKSRIQYFLRAERIENLVVAFDNTSEPLYPINSSMKYSEELKLSDTPFKEILMKDLDKLQFRIKSEEHLKRLKAAEESGHNKSIETSIENMKVSDEEREKIFQAYQQSRFVSLQTYHTTPLKKLATLDLVESCEIDKLPVKFILCNQEADLCIKNYASKNFDSPFLVLSSDTDYYILFSDNQYAYCKSIITNNVNTYNVMNLWKSVLKEKYSYDVVVRIAPLLGNDYTIKSFIGTAQNIEQLLALFSRTNEDIKVLKSISGRTNLKKMLKVSTEINQYKLNKSFIDIDNLILKYSLPYFKHYLLSVLIYLNTDLYTNYEVLTPPLNELKEQHKNKLIENIKSLYKVLYDLPYDTSDTSKEFKEIKLEIQLENTDNTHLKDYADIIDLCECER